MGSIQLHRTQNRRALMRVHFHSASSSVKFPRREAQLRFLVGMCAGAPRSAMFQLCIHMSKMTIVINVHILSMLDAYVENGRRN